MNKLDSLVHIYLLPMRPLRNEHNGIKACNDADPCPTVRNGRVPAGCGYYFGTSPNLSERGQSAGNHHSKPVFKTPSTPLDVHLSTRSPSTIRASTHASF